MRAALLQLVAVAVLGGCALSVSPSGGPARDASATDLGARSRDATAQDAGRPVADALASPCATLSCCSPADRQLHALPTDKACRVDTDCVVRIFSADTVGTLEIAALSATGAAAFDLAATICRCSQGAPPGLPFFEADGGALDPRFFTQSMILDSGVAVARCLAGCCTAVPADGGRD